MDDLFSAYSESLWFKVAIARELATRGSILRNSFKSSGLGYALTELALRLNPPSGRWEAEASGLIQAHITAEDSSQEVISLSSPEISIDGARKQRINERIGFWGTGLSEKRDSYKFKPEELSLQSLPEKLPFIIYARLIGVASPNWPDILARVSSIEGKGIETLEGRVMERGNVFLTPLEEGIIGQLFMLPPQNPDYLKIIRDQSISPSGKTEQIRRFNLEQEKEKKDFLDRLNKIRPYLDDPFSFLLCLKFLYFERNGVPHAYKEIGERINLLMQNLSVQEEDICVEFSKGRKKKFQREEVSQGPRINHDSFIGALMQDFRLKYAQNRFPKLYQDSFKKITGELPSYSYRVPVIRVDA